MREYEYNGRSALVENMRTEASEMETFPALVGNTVAHFHDVDGGYNRDNLYDVVKLIHRVQAPGSPYRVNTDELPHRLEVHLTDNYYNLSVDGIRATDNYPNENYVLCLKVSDDMHGEYSFSKPMTEDIDRRERSERL